ncbi:MAG: single-stranded DNA-binding protein [Clostridia bacterium]
MENYNENNVVEIGGKISSEIEISHELFEEKFYKFTIDTKRLSDLADEIPIIVSERLVDLSTFEKGEHVCIKGQFRSYNQVLNGKSKLVLSIFAKEIVKASIQDDILTLNEASFIGYICKNPIYRKTPLGREIADVLVAVNRSYKKSDYIPCILWGRNAKFCETLGVGSKVKLSGRIQSRKYEKKLEDGTILPKVAYELSVSKFSVNRDNEQKQQIIDSDEKVEQNLEENIDNNIDLNIEKSSKEELI